MAIRKYVNTATQATTNAAIASTDTSITLTNFAGYPVVPYTAALGRGTANEEIVLVTAVASNTVTVTRGYDGTTAKAQTAGTTFLHVVTAIDFLEANIHVNATSAVHGVAGAIVGTTDAQTISGKTFSGNSHVATAAADALLANVPSGITKNILTGQNNGVTTFAVSQTGVLNASGQVNALAGLAVTGAGTVSTTFTVSGLLTASAGQNVTGTLAVTGAATVSTTLGVTGAATLGSTASVAGLLTASAGLRVTSAGIRHVPITAPAGTAGDVTEWVQSDGGFYFRNGTGAPARSLTHWGTVAAPANYPTGALVGDTVVVTSLASSLMRYNGSAWKQVEPADVASRAARNALTGQPAGFKVLLTDELLYYRWDGAAWVYIGGTFDPNTATATAGHNPSAGYRQSAAAVAHNSDTVVTGFNNNRVDSNVVTFDSGTGTFTFTERGLYFVVYRAAGDGANPARQLHYIVPSTGIVQQSAIQQNVAFDGQSNSGYSGAGILTAELPWLVYADAGDSFVTRIYQVNAASANRSFDFSVMVTKLPHPGN